MIEGWDEVGSCVGVVGSIPTMRKWRRRLTVDGGLLGRAHVRAHVRAEMWSVVWRCDGKGGRKSVK